MKMIFANLEEIPEALRKDAVKNDADGTFTLEGDGILKKNNELLTKNTQYKEVYDKFKGLDGNIKAEDIKKAIEEMSRADQRETEIQERIQAAVREAAGTWQGKITEANTERDRMREALEERIITADLTTAVAAGEGDPFFVVPALKNSVRTVQKKDPVTGKMKYVAEIVGSDGKARINEKGEPMSIAELVVEAKGKKEFGSVFKAPTTSGSGSQSSELNAGGGPAGGGNGKAVTLTAAQAKDPNSYRQALESVKGDRSLLQITD